MNGKLHAFDDDIAAAEAGWQTSQDANPPPNVVRTERPSTAFAVTAHNFFADDLQAGDIVAAKCVEMGLAAGVTKDTYSVGKQFVALCRTTRGRIEKARKEGVADAVEWQRAVNSKAKELIQAIESVEEPIKAGCKAIDDEKERLKREKEEAERQAVIDAENARLAEQRAKEQADRDAEAARFAADQARLAEERKAFEAQQELARKESARIQAEAAKKLADERAEMEAERQRLAAIRDADERERKAAQSLIDEANRLERERIAAEAAKVEEARAAGERQRLAIEHRERERIEAAERAEADRLAKIAAEEREARLAPDREKMRAWIKRIRTAQNSAPVVASDDAKACVNRVTMTIDEAVAMLESFGN